MIINVNKPKGYTSRDIVNILSKYLNTKKVGHTGTLDPIASGVLIIVTDEDTKLVDFLTSKTKEYLVEMQLGIKTDTGDITGTVLEKAKKSVSDAEIKECLNNFKGEYLQEVPIYSAVKVKGKKLYEYARNNESVDLPKRNVVIFDNTFIERTNDIVKFKVSVSKGTYIRSLINDICEKLGTVGTMSNLTRTHQGLFTIDDANSLDDIQNNTFTTISKEELLQDFPFEKVTKENEKQILNGALIPKTFTTKYLIYTNQNGNIIAMYQEYVKNVKLAKPYIMFKR